MQPSLYFAPGRVNLIGEHIDYNGGLVMPVALNLGIRAEFHSREDGLIKLRSSSHSKTISFFLDELPETYKSENDWGNYPIGIILALQKQGLSFKGFELYFESNLPEGAGLSSSAAIEVLTAYMLLKQAGVEINLTQLALLCRHTENTFIGVNCGIMDQFAVANGKKDCAILLDCKTLQFEYLPFVLDDYSLIIIDSRKPRSLIKSAYNERKAESEAILELLIKSGALNADQQLAEASMSQLDLIVDPLLKQRGKHIITENIRVKLAASALRMGDLITFGRLMNASHQSLKEDYEVTGPELDLIAETAQQTKGCAGARMTGGGFGGCAIALVKTAEVPVFCELIEKKYMPTTGLMCRFFIATAGDGVTPLA